MNEELMDCIECNFAEGEYFSGENGPYCATCHSKLNNKWFTGLWKSLGGMWYFQLPMSKMSKKSK